MLKSSEESIGRIINFPFDQTQWEAYIRRNEGFLGEHQKGKILYYSIVRY